jgi:hypothetical protein
VVFRFFDRLAARINQRRSNEDWAKWQLCRFAETALEIMCYSLSRGIMPSETPESLFEEGQAPTFGVIRGLALKFAAAAPAKMNIWGANFFASVLKNKAGVRALEAINTQRNNLAHGRTTLPLAEIKKLVVQGVQLDAWAKIFEADGELRLVDWIPWVVTSGTGEQIGLFERWQKNVVHYLVPETGEVFKVPRISREFS